MKRDAGPPLALAILDARAGFSFKRLPSSHLIIPHTWGGQNISYKLATQLRLFYQTPHVWYRETARPEAEP